MKPRTLIIPNERPKSWNNFYSGLHWSKRKQEADRIHMMVRAYLDPDTPMFDCRVDIETVVYFDKDPLDSCNIPDKIYIDGFIGWWIEDDDMRYVRSAKTEPRLDPDNPRVEITFIPIEGERIEK